MDDFLADDTASSGPRPHRASIPQIPLEQEVAEAEQMANWLRSQAQAEAQARVSYEGAVDGLLSDLRGADEPVWYSVGLKVRVWMFTVSLY